jgi:2-dehydropantoate 2-reductase
VRLLVLGAGAVGLWLGANLLRAGHRVIFAGRSRFVEAANRDGLSVQLPYGDIWQLDDVAVEDGVAQAMRHEPFDAIALCTKAYDVDAAVAQLRDFMARDSRMRLMCFQNGIGAEESCTAAFGPGCIIAATLTSPVSLESPATIRLERERGGVGMAAMIDGTSIDTAMRSFEAAPLLRATHFADWRSMKWSKLLLNLVGNATGAILDLPVAAVLADADLAQVEMRMLREAVAVMDGLKLRAVDLPGAPVSWLVRAIRLLPDPLLRETIRRSFARARGDKRPSLYYDALKQAGRSEVTYLNGAVVEAGRALGIPTPSNLALTAMLLDVVNTRVRLPPAQARSALLAAALSEPGWESGSR